MRFTIEAILPLGPNLIGSILVVSLENCVSGLGSTKYVINIYRGLSLSQALLSTLSKIISLNYSQIQITGK